MHATKLQAGLAGQPVLDAGHTAGFGDADNRVVLRRDTEVFEFLPLEFDTGLAEHLLEKQTADEMADGQAVGFGDFVDVICRNQGSCAGHILNDEGWIAGDVFAQMARDHAGIRIIAAAG